MKKILTVVLVLLIITAIGIGGWYFYKNQRDTNDEISRLKNEIREMKEEATTEEKDDIENTNNNTNNSANTNSVSGVKISNIVGAYDNGGGETNFQSICIYENGTFEYYPSGEIDSHDTGYYVINDNKITFYCILSCGNDPTATVTSKKYDGSFNNGVVTFNNIEMKKSSAAQSRYNNGSENGGIDIGNEINSRLRSNYLISE